VKKRSLERVCVSARSNVNALFQCLLNCFGTLEALYTFFNNSNRRWDKLTAHQGTRLDVLAGRRDGEDLGSISDSDTDDIITEDVSPQASGKTLQKKPVQRVCPTRWSSRRKATQCVVDNFGLLLDCLE